MAPSFFVSFAFYFPKESFYFTVYMDYTEPI
jgi:hypothetical protein